MAEETTVEVMNVEECSIQWDLAPQNFRPPNLLQYRLLEMTVHKGKSNLLMEKSCRSCHSMRRTPRDFDFGALISTRESLGPEFSLCVHAAQQ
jgi:hypothetical protein